MDFERPVNEIGLGNLFTGCVLSKWDSLNSQWLHIQYIPAFSLPSFLSGATNVASSQSSLGGVNLDADTEYIYMNMSINSDWCTQKTPFVDIYFETDQSNLEGGNDDMVQFQMLYHMKGIHEVEQRNQTVITNVKIGKAAQGTLFLATFPVNITGKNAIKINDEVAARLSFVQSESAVTDVIVCQIHWHYSTNKIHLDRIGDLSH